MPYNIVQLELTLLKFQSPEHIFSEVLSRAKDNKRTKLVVRIFDTSGKLTEHVQHMQRLRIRSEEFYQWLPADFLNKPFLTRWIIERRRARLAAKNIDARKKLIELGIGAIRDTIKALGPIGVEDYPGAPFRLAKFNELHELAETARCARSAWAFVLKPNDLLSDENTPVAYAM